MCSCAEIQTSQIKGWNPLPGKLNNCPFQFQIKCEIYYFFLKWNSNIFGHKFKCEIYYQKTNFWNEIHKSRNINLIEKFVARKLLSEMKFKHVRTRIQMWNLLPGNCFLNLLYLRRESPWKHACKCFTWFDEIKLGSIIYIHRWGHLITININRT